MNLAVFPKVRQRAGPSKLKGVYADLDELIRLQFKATGFSFLPKQPVHSLLSGRHASRLRGRGLDFEEVRNYIPGDDIRTIDWKITARTQKPHIRVYTEERERPVLVVADQRISMFFGTRVNMKSVTAAEAAALAAWRVVSAGDRVGAVVFNDSEIREVRPHRSKKTVMQILNIIVEQNHLLGVDRGITSSPDMLNKTLEKVVHLAKHDYLVCIMSDFFGITDNTNRLIKLISRHNDVIIGLIYDPIAKELPDAGKIVISDSGKQIELDMGSRKLREQYPEILEGRLKSLTDELAKYGVPVLPIHTAEGVAEQVRAVLGYSPGMRRR
jgi:uncharacterized protein (DUF58 family)